MIKTPPGVIPYTLLTSDNRSYPYNLILRYVEPTIYEQIRTRMSDDSVVLMDTCDYDSIMNGFLWSSSEDINVVEVFPIDCPPQIGWDVYPQDINMNLGAKLWGRILTIADYLCINPKTLNPLEFQVSYGIPGGFETEYHHVPRRLNRPRDIPLDEVQVGVTYCYIMHRIPI